MAARARKPADVVEVCLVASCRRIAKTRGLCDRHYLSLSRALKQGIEWDIKTGKPVVSAYKPKSPLDDLPATDAATDLPRDELSRIQAMVEIDAARLLPHALAFCLGQTLLRTGLADNPAALRAFAESCRPPALPPATERAAPKTPRRKRRVQAT